MKNCLITALIEKNAFREDTIITACYTSRDLFGRSFHKTGQFQITRIIRGEQDDHFEIKSMDGIRVTIPATQGSITAIDGMDVIRYADIYDLKPDGSFKKMGKKRGRKPKVRLTA